MASALPTDESTAVLSLHSPSGPIKFSQTASPPDSPIRNVEDGKLPSSISVLTNGTKPLEERGPNSETLPETVAQEERPQSSHSDISSSARLDSSHTRVRQEDVSIETLRIYHIDNYIDVAHPESIVITRSVPDFELDFLKRHTAELLQKQVDKPNASPTELSVNSPKSPAQLQPLPGPPGHYVDVPLRSTVGSDGAIYSGHIQLESSRGPPPPPGFPGPRPPLSRGPPPPPTPTPSPASKIELSLEINRVPFDKWLTLGSEEKPIRSVLDVAMQRREPSEMKPAEASDVGAPGTQQNFEEPVRLGINSEHIWIQLKKITGYDINDYNAVFHPPWKLIVTYYEDIKKRLHELEIIAVEELSETLTLQKDQPENTPVGIENESMEVERKVKAPEEEGGSSKTQACKICDKSNHEEKLECLKDTISHLKCFCDFVENELKHVFDLRQGLKDATIREIAFEDLWHLFTPGDLLVTSGPRHERQAHKVFYTSGGRPTVRKHVDFEKHPITTPFAIDCFSIDFDKKWLGPVHRLITVPRYEGKRPITALPMVYSDSSITAPKGPSCPVRFLEEPDVVIADLVKRGKRHKELTPFSHKRYCGPSAVASPEYLNSDIIIDFEQDSEIAIIGKFEEIRVNKEEVVRGCTLNGPCYDCDDIFDDNIIDKAIAERYKEDQHLLGVRDANGAGLTDDHFMLLNAWVDGFVLQERDIFAVYIDFIKDLDGDHGESLKALKAHSGFEDLVLPEGHGDLVEALVRTHRSTRKRRNDEAKVQVDLIDGKGEGLVILLHGVPGVGKTSTAECVAAYCRRPLYPITCANIGLDPEEVEKNLTGPDGHFRKAQQWNCVVLLDEADVFLAKRETRDNDAKRNALVSVFLRTLEYYPGILILTTNRVGSFDEAVVSRIQIFLYYPPLDEDKTMKVWKVHINRVRSSGLISIDYENEEKIMEFAEEEYAEGKRWNGRQIRNFFQTAISLASYDATKWRQSAIEEGQVDQNSKPDKPRLTVKKLKIVVATSGKFIDYIKSTVPDGSHQEQQLVEGNRNDGWEETPTKHRR